MRVIVGSLNPVKIESVRLGFEAVWPHRTWHITGSSVSSGIASQPMSDEETLQGARNRAALALQQGNADFGVGLEGGLQQIGGQYYDSGWIVVRHRDGIEGIGSTVRMPIPEDIMRLILGGMELGDAIDAVHGTTNARQKQGHFGLMTNNLITRTSGYRDAVIVALATHRLRQAGVPALI